MKEKAKKLLDQDSDLTIWFISLCEAGPEAIKAQAWQIADVLKADKHEVRDAMLEFAHELLPDSPAGEDPRQTLFRELGVWASRQPQGVQDKVQALLEGSTQGSEIGSFQNAWEGPLNGFRGYLRSVCRIALEEDELEKGAA